MSFYHTSWYMGLDALMKSGISHKMFYLIRDRHLTPVGEPLTRVRKSRIILFILVQLTGFGATFAITQTIGSSWLSQAPKEQRVLFIQIETDIIYLRLTAAIGFPVIIMLLIPLRIFLIPRLPFTNEELAILDGPTASPFVSRYSLESVRVRFVPVTPFFSPFTSFLFAQCRRLSTRATFSVPSLQGELRPHFWLNAPSVYPSSGFPPSCWCKFASLYCRDCVFGSSIDILSSLELPYCFVSFYRAWYHMGIFRTVPSDKTQILFFCQRGSTFVETLFFSFCASTFGISRRHSLTV